MIITDEDIAAARTGADAAAQALAVVDARALAGRVNDETALELARLTAAARQAHGRVERLAAEQAQQQRALEARAARERAAAPALGAAVKELEASRGRLVSAVNRGDLLGAAVCARAHDELVATTAALLVGAGLRMSDVDEAIDHQTGAAEGRAGLRLRGRWWGRVDPASLLAWMAHRAALAALGRRNLLTMRYATMPGVADVAGRGDGLLEGVADLPAALDPPLPQVERLNMADLGQGAKGSSSERYEIYRLQHPEPVPGWEDRFREQFGRDPGDAA